MIQRITPDEAMELARVWLDVDPPELAIIAEAAAASDPALAGWLGSDLLAIGGFIPTSIVGGTAFVWMQHTPAVARHKIATIRIGRDVLAGARTKYPRIIGTCSLGPQSEAWLTSLGARFVAGPGLRKPFVIEG